MILKKVIATIGLIACCASYANADDYGSFDFGGFSSSSYGTSYSYDFGGSYSGGGYSSSLIPYFSDFGTSSYSSTSFYSSPIGSSYDSYNSYNSYNSYDPYGYNSTYNNTFSTNSYSDYSYYSPPVSTFDYNTWATNYGINDYSYTDPSTTYTQPSYDYSTVSYDTSGLRGEPNANSYDTQTVTQTDAYVAGAVQDWGNYDYGQDRSPVDVGTSPYGERTLEMRQSENVDDLRYLYYDNSADIHRESEMESLQMELCGDYTQCEAFIQRTNPNYQAQMQGLPDTDPMMRDMNQYLTNPQPMPEPTPTTWYTDAMGTTYSPYVDTSNQDYGSASQDRGIE